MPTSGGMFWYRSGQRYPLACRFRRDGRVADISVFKNGGGGHLDLIDAVAFYARTQKIAV